MERKISEMEEELKVNIEAIHFLSIAIKTVWSRRIIIEPFSHEKLTQNSQKFLSEKKNSKTKLITNQVQNTLTHFNFDYFYVGQISVIKNWLDNYTN
jgi:hypothetical protein